MKRYELDEKEITDLKEEWGLTEEEVCWIKNLDARGVRMVADCLRECFTKEKIKDIIRRQALVFGGCSALDVILVGGYGEVIEKYNDGFSYQF